MECPLKTPTGTVFGNLPNFDNNIKQYQEFFFIVFTSICKISIIYNIYQTDNWKNFDIHQYPMNTVSAIYDMKQLNKVNRLLV